MLESRESVEKQRDTALADALTAAWSGAESNEQAAQALLAMMRVDTALYARAMQPVEHEVAARLTAAHKRERRSYIWNRPVQPDMRVAALARSNAVSLLDMRLPSGKRLGDATRDEVADAAESYRQAKEHHAAKERFFAALAQRIEDGRRVADVFTAADLEGLRDA